MRTPLDEALFLAAGGIPVFPCWPDGYGERADGRPYYKSPRIAGWQLHASTDEITIRGWFNQWPDSLVAVPTGRRSGLYVLDLDVKPEQGIDGRMTVQVLQPPRTRINHTLTGGMHLLYRLPTTGEAHTDAGMLGAGIDRRGDGGYVIWWPAHGGAVTTGPISPCPQWMVGAIRGDGPDETLPPMGLSDYEIHDLMRRINPASVAGRSEWLRIGMALHHETGGSERGLAMWDAYSMFWPKYEGRQVLEREWGTFGRTQRVQVTMRSYVPAGWQQVPPTVAFAGGTAVAPVAVAPAAQPKPAVTLRVPNLPQAVIDARDGTATTHPLSEAGNAKRLYDKYRDVLRYVPELKSWLYWRTDATGGQWFGDPEGIVPIQLALKLTDEIYTEAENNIFEAATYVKWARKSNEMRTARAVVAILATYADIRLPAAMLNTDIMLAGLDGARSVLDLRTGTVRAARPEDYITKSLGCATVGTAGGSTRWKSFVHEIFGGDMQLVDWMQRWCGYCLTGSTREEILLFAWGMGRNGKGTFFESIAHVLGEYAATVPSSLFEAAYSGGGEGPTPQLAKLQGARLVLASETNSDTPLNEAQLKNITGGDVITARGLNEKPITFLPQFKVGVQGNHKPLIRNMDYGVWSRIRMIPFLRTFSAPDKTLKARFRDEAADILAWMLEGCLKWQQRGLDDLPEAIANATASYKDEMDVIGEWMNERCVVADRATTSSSVLYASYSAWASDSGHKNPLTRQAFGRRLSDRGFIRSHTRDGWQWTGLSIRL